MANTPNKPPIPYKHRRDRYLIERSSPRGIEIYDSDIGEYLLKSDWEALQIKQFADKDRK